MTVFIPTCTVSILRGETTDAYGDPVDASTVAASAVPMSIIEQQKRVWVPAESRTTVVRMYAGRARPGVDVRTQDRLRDEASMTIYQVEGVSAPASPLGASDVRLDLRRIDQ